MNRLEVRGFTLIEVMIVVAVVGILAAVAYPSFVQQMIRSDRSDARSALMQVQLAQERFRMTNSQYSADLSVINTGLALSGSSLVSEQGLYIVAIVAGSADRGGYEMTATAQGKQANDKVVACRTMALRVTQGGEQRGHISDGIFVPSQECW